jgi:hypothetical protein
MVDWPDDTLELMERQLQPQWPLAVPVGKLVVPVSVPVETADGPALFTAMLPVPTSAHGRALADDRDVQARNAVEASVLAHRHARRSGLAT